jgi:DNA processing protein
MSSHLSPNTQVALLLTAPLVAGRSDVSPELLTPSEYLNLARLFGRSNLEIGELLVSDFSRLPNEVRAVVDNERYQQLLNRGFQLTQALERWQSRAIWIVGNTDENYPKRLTQRLRERAPSIIYGCGDTSLLDSGGLAVVGSRDADASLLEFTENVGRLAAEAKRTIVSGGARGIDQAAMRGALEQGGNAVGVLADSLDRAVVNRENRDLLLDGHLALISPYDPSVGFNVGHAMQRNKLIYALADAALVVSCDFEKGGTWAGAVEQLEKLHFVPVYVRSPDANQPGLAALTAKGAHPWPNPNTIDEFNVLLDRQTMSPANSAAQLSLLDEVSTTSR